MNDFVTFTVSYKVKIWKLPSENRSRSSTQLHNRGLQGWSEVMVDDDEHHAQFHIFASVFKPFYVVKNDDLACFCALA